MSGRVRSLESPLALGMEASAVGLNDAPGRQREEILQEAIAQAMSLLSEAAPGEIAMMYVCRGAPVCTERDQPCGFNSSCAKCECIAVSEDGVVGYPQSGNA